MQLRSTEEALRSTRSCSERQQPSEIKFWVLINHSLLLGFIRRVQPHYGRALGLHAGRKSAHAKSRTGGGATCHNIRALSRKRRLGVSFGRLCSCEKLELPSSAVTL
eukprot:scaffold29043_cov112-Isochrysis_galbana.AAC.5